MALGESFRERAREIISRYPVKRSALLMVLHEAQDEVGYLSAEAIREVADVMDLSPANVAGVATFYTMFKQRPVGRHLVSLCTNVSCAVWGADETASAMRELIGPPHQPTPDGAVSWEPVECLAYCDWAPAAQVNYRDVPQLTPQRAERLVSELRSGRPLEEVLAEFRRAGPVREQSDA